MLILLFSGVGFLAYQINFEENISKLLPSDEESDKINQVLKGANFSDKIIIHISGNDIGEMKNYADELKNRILENNSESIKKFQVRLEDNDFTDLLDFIDENLPLFLDETDYKSIDEKLQSENLKLSVEEAYKQVNNPTSMVSSNYIRLDPLNLRYLALSKLQSLQTQGEMSLDDGYLMSAGKKDLLAFITTSNDSNDTAKNEALVVNLEEEIEKLNAEFRGKANAEYFGSAGIAYANAKQIKKDIVITLSIALTFLFALYIYFYKRIYIPFIILIPGIFGSLCGIAFLYLLKGTISAVSIGIGSVLLGITLDYSLHILSHYKESGNVQKLFRDIVKPLLLCAAFTSADFLCLMFLKSEVLRDLGIFAAVSVSVAAVFALIFFPQVYKPNQFGQQQSNTWIDKLANYDVSKVKPLVYACLIISFICLFTFNKVGFNNDLNSLNFMPEKFILAEKHLDELNHFSDKSIYLLAYGDSYDDAIQTNSKLNRELNQLRENEKISSISSIGDIVLSNEEQQDRINRWNAFWNEEKKRSMQQILVNEGQKYGFKGNAFQPFYDRIETGFSVLEKEDYGVLNDLFIEEFVSVNPEISVVTTIVKVDRQDAAQIVEKFSKEHPNVLVVDRKHLQEKFMKNLETDFNNLLWISTIVVFVFVYLFFGNLLITLITNIPILLGWLITTGIMGIFGIQFNAFNTIITTLIFGLGIDYSIFITQGLLDKHTYGKSDLPAYRSGIIMSAITTLLCFGVLVFAKHPAIRSLAFIPIIGIFSVVMMSLTIQPWLFRILIQNLQDKGFAPKKFPNMILSFLTFGYFITISILLSLFSQLILPILPVSKNTRLKIFHRSVRKVFSTLIYRTPNVKTEIVGYDPSLYDKPSIVIANHSSQLDTLTMGMLHEKQIFMVNSRIHNNKLYGKAIQKAGFYPTSQDLEEGKKLLEEKTREGYSIIIFPEGTRSENAHIRRFHKGAFYLAEQLKLDILPVLIHGNADVLPKNDKMLNSGRITIKFLPKIKPDDENFGKNYAERTRKITEHLRVEFKTLRNEKEDEDYFWAKLWNNYTYKSKYIRKAVRSEFKSKKSAYHDLMRQLPGNCNVLHIGSKYGVLDLLLAYDEPTRKIIGIDSVKNAAITNQLFSIHRYQLKFSDLSPKNPEVFKILILQVNLIEIDWKKFTNLEYLVVFNTYDKFSKPDGFRQIFENSEFSIFHRA